MHGRRSLVLQAAALLALGALPDAMAEQALPPIMVYKGPACGCCGEWTKHLRASGFRVETRDVADMRAIRRQYGVPDALSSCHTAVVGGYAIEGHVPAQDIKRLVREKPKAIGLAVPGMVAGSPGMEQGSPQPYATLLFDQGGSRVFARH